jgi:type IV pilus assembly protein PilX
MNRRASSSFRPRARQRGIVLIVALIVMVATILAAIALISSIDVATLISGNLAFRQSGVQAADAGVEVARKWLMAQPTANLETPRAPSYWATFNGGAVGVFNPATFDWTNNASAMTTDPNTGNTVAYVVHRMCGNTGAPDPSTCVTAKTSGSDEGSSKRIKEGGEYFDAGSPGFTPFYRITVRVSGPRSTVTYVQAVIY